MASGLAVAGAAAPAGAAPLPVVTSGGGHSCALMPDQSVWCWGRNTTGQLGDGTATDSMVPVWVRTLLPAIDVSAGHDHTCAVMRRRFPGCPASRWANRARPPCVTS